MKKKKTEKNLAIIQFVDQFMEQGNEPRLWVDKPTRVCTRTAS